jgi:hypothetical protein
MFCNVYSHEQTQYGCATPKSVKVLSAYVILNAQGNKMGSMTACYEEMECVDT